MTAALRTAEQDKAASGPEYRRVPLPNGGDATGSVALRLYQRTRRVRAYLRWSEHGRTRERYIGEVRQATRAANLADAWALARQRGLTLVPRVGVEPQSWASSPAVRAVMRANRGRDTKPEMLLRSQLHRMGLRYRVAVRPLSQVRRTADVVFTKAKVAVFVDGCYWHGCPEHHRPATKNAAFWSEKIAGNKSRDAETDQLLINAGWTVIRIWEHESPDAAAATVAAAVKSRESDTTGP
ncbi:very short patch repair endonuclease [Actinacidiphila oryziradicis]|uniref:Very short patch repair endonuclease n=2 Tax=Actinacidiphila oryziradicis TaxID=2571141 RepID=A0A4U0SJ18_9ACTN|nr:very short patch repair endonuclease [Actinacidiphila oryziradicis]